MSFKPRGAPATRRQAIVEALYGTQVADPYRWLEDAGDAAVQAWMSRQDRHTRRQLGTIPARRDIAAALRPLFYYDAVSAPARRGNRSFYSRRHADKEKAIAYWREGDDGPEQVLFDPNAMSEDGSVSLGTWAPCHDGVRVAYALRENAADEATLHIRDVATGRDLPDVIEGAKYAEPAWTPDGEGFYYTYLPTDPSIPVDERPGHAEVRYHELGTDPGSDPVIYPRTGSAQTFLSPSLSRDGRLLTITVSHGWNATDVYVRDLTRPADDFRPLVAGVDAIYWVTAFEGRLFILTNEGAPRYRVFRADADAPQREAWREIVPESDATIEAVRVIGGRLVLSYLRNAASELEIRTLDGDVVRTIDLPGIGTVDSVVGTEVDDTMYYAYSSFVEPTRIVRTSVAHGGADEWARVSLPVDTDAYVVDQVFYESRDGTRISMFVIRRRDVDACDGDRPTILYGYGGFNVSLTPAFSPALPVWLDRGGIYAIPNLRGGGEYGEDWHKAGMGDSKQNVFDDFIAAAEYLIAAGYTRPERLAIRGGSNGGLLVGAAMTQRPELFGAVVCAVPLLDMLRYHLFGSGRTWIPEYGSAENEPDFRVLHAYSPYHRVDPARTYPPLLMLSADSDDRVDPMHARKFVAAVQHGGSDALLRIERQAGHGGADMVVQQIEQTADAYAFLCDRLGVDS